MRQQSHDLFKRVDASRVEFLKTDLAACMTLVRVAETEYRTGSVESGAHCITHAENGFRALHRILTDPRHIRHINEDAHRNLIAELDRLGGEIERVKQNQGRDQDR